MCSVHKCNNGGIYSDLHTQQPLPHPLAIPHLSGPKCRHGKILDLFPIAIQRFVCHLRSTLLLRKLTIFVFQLWTFIRYFCVSVLTFFLSLILCLPNVSHFFLMRFTSGVRALQWYFFLALYALLLLPFSIYLFPSLSLSLFFYLIYIHSDAEHLLSILLWQWQ